MTTEYDHDSYIKKIRNSVIDEEKDMFPWPMQYPLMSATQDLHTHMAHFYYMFDHQINPDIGSTIDDMQNMFKNIKAYDLFNIDPANISKVPIKEHVSVLYKFDRMIDTSVKYYLYYSN